MLHHYKHTVCVISITVFAYILHIDNSAEVSNPSGHEVTLLMNLDKNLTSMLSAPIEDDDEVILTNIERFWNRFQNLNNLVLKSEAIVLKSALYFVKQKLPQFIHCEINATKLRNLFGWSDEKVTKFNGLLSNITVLSSLFPQNFVNMVDELNRRYEDVSLSSL